MTMPKLIIDNREVEVPKGSTILEAAAKLGIEIPTMCFLKGIRPSTSCMVCVVEIEGTDKLLPACGTIAQEGMHIETNSSEVIEARKMALELLLSDHLGDCMGPCQMICPAHMDIPLMIRQIASGQLKSAIETVKKDIPLPAVLGRICPAPCEKGCRRSFFDKPLSICLLKRYVADVDIAAAERYIPICRPSTGKKVAIIGAGPAGLSSAYYLQQNGIQCTVFDKNEKAGGMIRYAIEPERLPPQVLDEEIAIIQKLGTEFVLNRKISSPSELLDTFDAVLAATGQEKLPDCSQPGIFAISEKIAKQKMAVRAVEEGKKAAYMITLFLSGKPVVEPPKPFNTRIGKIEADEINAFMGLVSKNQRQEPKTQYAGLTDEQAVIESVRCMHCDCRKADDCKLRQLSDEFHARPAKYASERRKFVQHIQHELVIYEPGKCIRCGLCIEIANEAKEPLGLTFIGRGFDVQVAVPFDKSLADGLKITAEKCANACPTGALAFKEIISG